MDKINVLVAGESKSGKTTLLSALKLSKKYNNLLNICDYDNINNSSLKKHDIVFFVMDIENEIDVNNIIYIVNKIEQCLFVPIFNKLDLYDFTLDEKNIISLPDDIANKITQKMSQLEKICIPTIGDDFCEKYIFCSIEYAYRYLYMSTCTKITSYSDPSIVNKLGQYEFGIPMWNKKTINDKKEYASLLTDLLRKSSKLNSILNSVGYTIQQTIDDYISNEKYLKMIEKHLKEVEINFNTMIQTEKFLNVLNYVINEFECDKPQSFSEIYLNIATHFIKIFEEYINTYDYVSLTFHDKFEVLKFYKENNSNLFDAINTSSIVSFLTAILSQEIETQLITCDSFYELVDKLYDCFDINNEICIENILLNHKSFKCKLFTNELKKNIEYALSKFEIDTMSFYLKIMEMKLNVLENLTDNNNVIESMLCVQEFLNMQIDFVLNIEQLKQYKILLSVALINALKKFEVNRELLIEKINDSDTLYVENMFYNLTCENTECESVTSDELENLSNNKTKKIINSNTSDESEKIKNKKKLNK